MPSPSTSLAAFALRDVVVIIDFLCVFYFSVKCTRRTLSFIIVKCRVLQSLKNWEKIQLTPSPFARTC